MAHVGKLLVGLGVVLVFVGGALWVGDRLGLGRLPGDLIWKSKNVTVYLPIATSILVSIVLTLLLNLWLGRK